MRPNWAPPNRGDVTMYARLVTGSIPSKKLDEAIQIWRSSVLPSVRDQRGFHTVRLLVDRENGKIASMALWETEADFQATVAWNQEQIAKFSLLFIMPPEVSGYELVIEV